NTGDARSAQISFNYGEITVIVTVNQAAYEAPAEDPVLEVSATEFQVAAEGDELNVRVTHNYDYTVTSDSEWVLVDPDGDDCFITVAENTDTEARVATLEFASEGLTKTVTIAQDASEETGDPLDVGSNLSKNETANTYVVTKAGDYTFSAAVMGNGPEGYLDAWVDAQELLGPGQSYYLWPTDDPNLVTFTKTDLKKAKAAIIWEDGDCIDGDPKFNSADKTIGFKANGNEGGALIALYNQYEEILWSWLIWCTDRPAEFTVTNSDGDQVKMMDRCIGATSVKPEDGNATYGYHFFFGRKDPIRLEADLAHKIYMQNTSKEYSETVLNPTMCFFFVGRDIEYFNGSVGTLTPDLWGDPYMPCSFALRQNFEQTEIVDVKKTIYDPCPPGYQVPPARVFDNITLSDIHLVPELGVNIDLTDGTSFFPFSGYGDEGNSAHVNSGWYGYPGFKPVGQDSDRLDDLCVLLWSATEGDYANARGNWLAAQAFAVIYREERLLLIQEPDTNLGINSMYHSVRPKLYNVRCIRRPVE
ncbi:MAG: BACON domain-containing protein, partial [Bacteroidales bacterium]|nr:BACON domain-containing protein [Candidatus Equibacterium intestinale]